VPEGDVEQKRLEGTLLLRVQHLLAQTGRHQSVPVLPQQLGRLQEHTDE